MLRALRVRTLIPAVLAVALCVALGAGCKKADPVAEADELLRTGKTDEAIAALTKLHEADPQAFDPVRLLADAAMTKKDYEGAVAWYRKLLDLPEGKKLKRNFIGLLHEALMSAARKHSAFPDRYQEALLAVAQLEDQENMAQAPAKQELFGLLVGSYERARAAGRHDDAIAIARRIGEVNYDAAESDRYLKAIARLERQKYFAQIRAIFDNRLKAKLVAAGAYQAENDAIVLSSEFTIPETTPEGLFDQTSETFGEEVHLAACLGLRNQLADVLGEWAEASPFGRTFADNHIQYFFNRALEGQSPDYQPPLDPERRPESFVGLVYACTGSLPVDFVVKGFYKFRTAFDFFAQVQAAFDDAVKAKLVAAGAYDEESDSFTFSSEFTVPEKTEDGRFDPESETFGRDVFLAACEGPRRQLADVLNEWAKASPLGRELEENHVQYFFNRAMEGRGATFEPPLDPENPPETYTGLVISCTASLPVDFAVKGFLRVKGSFARKGRGGAEDAAAPSEDEDEDDAETPADSDEGAGP